MAKERGKFSGSRSPRPSASGEKAAERSRVGTRGSFLIVGIGASAGGLEAFTQLLGQLPPDTGMAFVLVQHLDPDHESALTQILSRATSLPVRQIANDQQVEANNVYVIPPDKSLRIERGVLKLEARLHERKPHRPIDSFFESLSQDQGERAIGVVLSGTASDGTQGLEAIKAEGGITFAQDETAKHDSMPRSAVAAGVVDFVLSPAEIAHELARIAKHPFISRRSVEPTSPHAEEDRADAIAHEDDSSPLPSGGHVTEDSLVSENEAEGETGSDDGYRRVLSLLRYHSGVDFSLYRSSTIQRRIARRLVVNKKDTLDEYAAFLRGNAKELDALYSDVLIGVTSFFRNPEMFDALQREVLPKLLAERTDEPVRCWVLGCSTGQEAYSLAMSFVESAEKAPRMRRLQIFATDLNDKLLEKARQALYARTLAQDISPQRLRRFFVEEQGGYRVSKMLREMVVFARQNLISDPPFSRMDLISCRNLLIYLEPTLQNRVLPTFHYALNPSGFLLLGASESIGGFSDLFEPVDKKFKIFAKKPAPTPGFRPPAGKHSRGRAPRTVAPLLPTLSQPSTEEPAFRGEMNVQREADRVAVSQFAPPGVLINDQLQVLQFRGPTGAYLEPPAGKASFDVLKMAREGLMLPLRNAITQAQKENKPVRVESVRVKRDGETRTVDLAVIPLKNLPERCFLVVFEDSGESRHAASQERATPPAAALGKDEAQIRVHELETELSETREYLQVIQEQHEAANEELQAANEEAQSANEELQSINEELETSKEELESANEELITVNEEMNHRNSELHQLNDDLVNLHSSTRLPVVLLARDLTIRRFSIQAEKQWGLVATDIGRPVSHLRHGLLSAPDIDLRAEEHRPSAVLSAQTPLDLERIASEVIATVREQEHQVQDGGGRWCSLRVRPYITLENKVDGAVVVLIDIDAIKRSELAIAEARDYAQNTIETVRDPMFVLDRDLRVESANPSFFRAFHAAPAETIGRSIFDLGNRQWNIPALRTLLHEVLPHSKSIEDFLVEHDFPHIGRRSMLVNARRILDPSHRAERILLAIEDITARRQDEVNRAATSEQLERELAATRTLQEVSAQLIRDDDPASLYGRILDAAVRLTGADAASMQMLEHREDGMGRPAALRLLATRGFSPAAEKRWELVQPGATCSCGRALAAGERCVVRDSETCEWMAGSEDQAMYRQLGIRSAQSTPLFSRSGKLVGMISTQWRRPHTPSESDLRQLDILVRQAADLIERKQGEEVKARLAAIVASSNDAIISKDLQGIITSWNAGAQRLFGYTSPEAIGQPITMLMSKEHVGEESQILQRIRAGESIDNFETVRLRKDGSPVEISLTISPIKDSAGRVIGASKIARDITEQSRIGAERKQLLESERIARTQAERATRLQNEFLAVASHELRTPLNGILGWAQLLKRSKPTAHAVEEAVGAIERGALAQAQLIDDLLDMNRIMTGKLHLDIQSVHLESVIESALANVRPAADAKSITVHTNLGTSKRPIRGDTIRLQQVVWNLVANAVKFTPNGGDIEVALDYGEAVVELRVVDSGAGIRADFLPYVFDRFRQADAGANRRHGGLGLGLAIVKQIVELHGGTVSVKSLGEGKGATFLVSLPRTGAPGAADAPPQAVPDIQERNVTLQGVKALIIDDDPGAAELVSRLLLAHDAETSTANSGEEALALVAASPFDLVLSDIGMPGLDGYEFIQEMRKRGVSTPAIAITAFARPEDRIRALQSGFNMHLPKPVDARELLTVVQTVLRNTGRLR